MWRVQINADQPLQGNSGTVTVELGILPLPGDTLMVGDNNAQWRVVERTIIVHDAKRSTWMRFFRSRGFRKTIPGGFQFQERQSVCA